MGASTELLNFIYQNSEIGKNSLLELEKICDNTRFDNLLKEHCEQYTSFFQEAKGLLEKKGERPEGIGSFKNMRSTFMIKVNTLTDKYPSHLAEMLIQGATIGIIEVRKKLNHYRDADTTILELGKRLLEFGEKTVEEYKVYL